MSAQEPQSPPPPAQEAPKDKALPEKAPVKRSREEKVRKKGDKKGDKSADHFLKALNSLETTEEKLGAMCKKYAELFNDHRFLQNAVKQADKKYTVLQQENEQLQNEHTKAILTRGRLESLCRELQRQNKTIKEECISRMREEEEKKRELADKIQTTLKEIGTKLSATDDKNNKLRDDNLDMMAKLNSVCEQYTKSEVQIEKLNKQIQLEKQLCEVKLAKAQMEMEVEKEALLRQNQKLLVELEEMQASEINLKNQISMYNSKFDEFHKSLLDSNEAITGFKTEMDRMAKQIKKLEKETLSWKARYEQAHRTLLQMTEEKMKTDHGFNVASRKLVALESLCRTLQGHCSQLRSELKAAKGEVGGPTEDTTICSKMEAILNQTCPLKVKSKEPSPKAESPKPSKEEEIPVVECESDGLIQGPFKEASTSTEPHTRRPSPPKEGILEALSTVIVSPSTIPDPPLVQDSVSVGPSEESECVPEATLNGGLSEPQGASSSKEEGETAQGSSESQQAPTKAEPSSSSPPENGLPSEEGPKTSAKPPETPSKEPPPSEEPKSAPSAQATLSSSPAPPPSEPSPPQLSKPQAKSPPSPPKPSNSDDKPKGGKHSSNKRKNKK